MGLPSPTQACLMAKPMLLTSPPPPRTQKWGVTCPNRGREGIRESSPCLPTTSPSQDPGWYLPPQIPSERACGVRVRLPGCTEAARVSLNHPNPRGPHRSVPRLSGHDPRPLIWLTLSHLASLENVPGSQKYKAGPAATLQRCQPPRMLLTHSRQAGRL